MPSEPFVPAEWEIPRVLRYRLGYGPGRQRALEEEGHLLLVLHEAPSRSDLERAGQLFWRKPDGSWLSTQKTDGVGALNEHLDAYQRAVDRLATQLEAADGSSQYFELLGQLGPLTRATRNLYATLNEARKLQREEYELVNWRDRAYGLLRRVELLQDDAKNALEYEIARQSEAQAKSAHQMAVSAHRLNVLAAFFFPMATLSAFLGANLNHSTSDWKRYALFGMLGLAMGIGLTWIITRPVRQWQSSDGKTTTDDES